MLLSEGPRKWLLVTAKQSTDDGFCRVHLEYTSRATYTLEDRLLVPLFLGTSAQVVDNWWANSVRECG